LRWFLPIVLLLFALLVRLGEPLWLWVLFGLAAAAWLEGFASLGYKIARAERHAS
jgi:hypothetical protein